MKELLGVTILKDVEIVILKPFAVFQGTLLQIAGTILSAGVSIKTIGHIRITGAEE